MANTFYGFGAQQADTLEKLLLERDAQIVLLQTQIDNLNSWASTLAAKLNADFAAANLVDGLPLNLDEDYSEDPQAGE